MNPIQRRQFLGTSAAVATGLAVPLAFAEEKKKVSANEKIRVALIGCGGMGRANLSDFVKLPDFEITALCDVDPRQIGEALKVLKGGKRPTDKVSTVRDFRKVVDSKDVDAVIIGTPDHWHPY